MDKPMFNPGAVDTRPKTPEVVAETTAMFDPSAARADAMRYTLSMEALYDAPLGPLSNWSFSGLMTYEQCPYRRYATSVGGAREPSGPAAERGSQHHEFIENYIQCVTDELSPEIKHFRDDIDNLRYHYEEGVVEVEGNWGFTRDWKQADWTADNVWARIKLDVIHHESETSAHIIDWKTGKKFGNEVKHATQLLVYTIGAFMKYPELEYVEGEMTYLDKNERLMGRYTRDEAMLLKPKIEQRALIMTTATEFPPKPSKHNCKWCRLKEPLEGEETARCQWGVIA